MSYTLLIEKVKAERPDLAHYPDWDGNLVRGIVFDVDEETGAKSVAEIIETAGPGAERTIHAMMQVFDGWKFDGAQAQRTNFGRATSNLGMIRKIIEQLEAK
jgi:hypothetical protein